jgi:hypothetical protein
MVTASKRAAAEFELTSVVQHRFRTAQMHVTTTSNNERTFALGRACVSML